MLLYTDMKKLLTSLILIYNILSLFYTFYTGVYISIYIRNWPIWMWKKFRILEKTRKIFLFLCIVYKYMVFFFHRFSDNNYCRKQISRAIGRKTDKAPKSWRREKSCLIFCCKGVENVIDNFLHNYFLHDTSTPVAAVLDYLARRPNTQGPLFILENGAPLSRTYLVQAVRETLVNAGVSTTGYSGHSFRVGAASAVASAGLPDSTIQSFGHWKSSAFLSYIRVPVKHLISVSQLMIARQ